MRAGKCLLMICFLSLFGHVLVCFTLLNIFSSFCFSVSFRQGCVIAKF
jgi:hypothetical protein